MARTKTARVRWKKISERRDRKRRARLNKHRRDFDNWLYIRPSTVFSPKRVLLQREDTHEALTKFLSELRKRLRSGERFVLLDFRRTEVVFAGGGLLMYAELRRAIELYPEVTFRAKPSKTNRVNQVLQHLGIFAMLNFNSKVRATRPDVVNWRHARANDINCAGASAIIDTYESLAPKSKLLYKAASEAISNAVTHAYVAVRGDGLKHPSTKSWWMFCREDSDKFYMSVCDLGVGIPNTLTVQNAPEIVARILEKISLGGTPSDTQMILGAMEYARTRTRNPHQGKGLMDLRKIVEETPGAKMSVYSNRGCVEYSQKAGYTLYSYRNSIMGTLVVWSLPLTSPVTPPIL